MIILNSSYTHTHTHTHTISKSNNRTIIMMMVKRRITIICNLHELQDLPVREHNHGRAHRHVSSLKDYTWTASQKTTTVTPGKTNKRPCTSLHFLFLIPLSCTYPEKINKWQTAWMTTLVSIAHFKTAWMTTLVSIAQHFKTKCLTMQTFFPTYTQPPRPTPLSP